jgi:hypothetical protein
MKPRILEDTWPGLWKYALDPDPSAPPSRSPISGKVEFDIDMHHARWFSSWVSSLQKNIYGQTLHSTMSSIAHSHCESRLTYREDEVQGQPQEEPQATTVSPVPAPRYAPRKLALLDRHSNSSVASASARSFLSPEKPQPTAPVLSPIFQESEPQSARSALHSKVESWRATATSKPKLLSTTGQTSLEAPNIPNTVPIEEVIPTVTEESDGEIHLSDYQWSISSAGPNDYEPLSPLFWDGTPSVHLMERNQGSVLLTPSTRTSFGPGETEWSPISSIARLPSPDLAHRMLDDCPPTPSTATSWGAPSEWPTSPLNLYRPPSVHLGDRLDFSRPVTPSTATSWGASSPLPSPAYPRYRAPSVHLADRDGSSLPATPEFAFFPREQTAQPWALSWPYRNHRLQDASPDTSKTFPPEARPWSLAWPHYKTESAPAQRHKYPYLVICKRALALQCPS